MSKFFHRRDKWQILLLAVYVVAVPACSSVTNTRGNLPLSEAITSITEGKQNRNQVASILGSPSTKASFGKQEIWYYIGERTETLAFFDPTLVERKILAIKFDHRGVVQTIESYDATAGKPVKLVDRMTPTMGKELGVLQQIIGNLGRFSTPE